jgi:hypothetical protein
MLAVPNAGNGIDMKGGPYSTIGGSVLGAGNLISGNSGNGILLSTSDASYMNVKANRVGVAGDGSAPLPNALAGILLDQGAFYNTIGGEFGPVLEQNIISHNGGAGVGLTASAGPDNYIDPNYMYANGGLGVDIYDDEAVLPNDNTSQGYVPDSDGGTDGVTPPGPNRLMNYPVINNATYANSTLTVDFTLETFPSHYYNSFFFWNETCDPSGFGEAQHFLGSLGLNSGPTGIVQKTQVINRQLAGQIYITMAASDPESSSEYSECFLIDTGVSPTPSPVVTSTPVWTTATPFVLPTGNPYTPTPTPSPTAISTPTLSPTPTLTPSPTPTPTPSASPTPTPTAALSPKQGDMNCDDDVTVHDFSELMKWLATGERGDAPTGCPEPSDSTTTIPFMDMDCSLQPSPFPGNTPVVSGMDALVLLAYFVGIDLGPPNCPDPGERLT